MKVALIARKTLYTAVGGDTLQVQQTARYLNELGIAAEVKLTHEKIDYSRYDLLHFFNLTRPADILRHIEQTDKPFALSPIWINYSEYDKHHRKGVSGSLFRFLSGHRIEYLKAIARAIKGKDLLPCFSYLLKGHRTGMKEILRRSAIIFPNSYKEYEQIVKQLSIETPFIKVPNGVEPHLFRNGNHNGKDAGLVVCAARIEGIKNQLNLIKALNNTAYTLLIIGDPAPNQHEYYERCKKIAADNVVFIRHLPQQELVSYYQKAKVHIQPSWFESCGLSSLEAGLMGCNIVLTQKGFSKEYFQDMAFYCDPSSPSSILKAVENASRKETNIQLQQKILRHYTWQQAAIKTLEGYRQILTA
jgi:glycosyltransferase involved in cell wall biosynthesis